MLVNDTSPWMRCWPRLLRPVALLPLLLSFVLQSGATTDPVPDVPKKPLDEHVLIRDITSVAGVRENPLVGYGIVVGLHGTGDSRQTVFPTQTLANILQRMGVQIPPASVRVNNIAA